MCRAGLYISSGAKGGNESLLQTFHQHKSSSSLRYIQMETPKTPTSHETHDEPPPAPCTATAHSGSYLWQKGVIRRAPWEALWALFLAVICAGISAVITVISDQRVAMWRIQPSVILGFPLWLQPCLLSLSPRNHFVALNTRPTRNDIGKARKHLELRPDRWQWCFGCLVRWEARQ